jgi:hypothetical protein
LKPKLAADVKVIDGYDIVFVGYPNWWEVFQCQSLHFWKNMIFLGKLFFHFLYMREGV